MLVEQLEARKRYIMQEVISYQALMALNAAVSGLCPE